MDEVVREGGRERGGGVDRSIEREREIKELTNLRSL